MMTPPNPVEIGDESSTKGSCCGWHIPCVQPGNSRRGCFKNEDEADRLEALVAETKKRATDRRLWIRALRIR